MVSSAFFCRAYRARKRHVYDLSHTHNTLIKKVNGSGLKRRLLVFCVLRHWSLESATIVVHILKASASPVISRRIVVVWWTFAPPKQQRRRDSDKTDVLL